MLYMVLHAVMLSDFFLSFPKPLSRTRAKVNFVEIVVIMCQKNLRGKMKHKLVELEIYFIFKIKLIIYLISFQFELWPTNATVAMVTWETILPVEMWQVVTSQMTTALMTMLWDLQKHLCLCISRGKVSWLKKSIIRVPKKAKLGFKKINLCF